MTDGRIEFKASARFEEAVRNHQRLTAEVSDLAKHYGATKSEIRGAHRALVAEEREASKSAKTHRDLGTSIKALRGPLAVATAAIGGMGAAVFKITKGMSELVDRVNLMSEASGLSVPTVIALERALAENGSTIEKVQGGLNEFSRRIADAATKGGEAAKIFDQWGLAYTDLDGSIRDTNETFRDAIRLIDRLEDPTDRAAARLQIFGNEAARAMAALDSARLMDAEASTQGLADAIERAQGKSAAWDLAMADLNTSIQLFTAEVGSQFTDDVVTITGALSAAVKTTAEWSGTIYEATQWMRWSNPVGVLAGKTIWNLAGGYEEAAKQIDNTTDALKDYGEAIGLTAPYTPGKRRSRPGRSSAGGGKSQMEIEAEQDELEGQRQERLRAERERAAAERMRNEQAAEEAFAAADKRRHDEEVTRLEELRDLRYAAAEAGISAFADVAKAAGAAGPTLWALQKAEALGYQAVAMARAMAEGGPIAGIPAALGMAGIVGAAIAEAASAQSRHMGGMAPDEGVMRVRNNEVMVETPSDRSRSRGGDMPTVLVQLDEMIFASAQARHGRRDSLFGDRRGRATAVGHA